jgi:FAD/FMN-containing dehydrogenase
MATALTTSVRDALVDVVGAAGVLDAEADRRSFGADFSDGSFPLPAAVVRPTTPAEVADVVKVARRHRLAVVGRGGGMSYTRSHIPDHDGAVVLDMSGFTDIQIHAADRYVVVGVGVTWAQLYAAVKPTGFWVPHLGTLSGLYATVGGGLSQQVTGLGHGYLTDYVLGLEVVLGDGSVLRTGSWAAAGTAPVLREFGPDLNGLFLVDSGAFGIKTRAVLRLDPIPRGTSYGMFRFENHYPMVAAMAEIGGTALATNVIGSDHHANEAMGSMPPPPKEVMVRLVKDVLRSGTSRTRSARHLAQAAKGKGVALKQVPNALLLTADSTDTAAADRAMRELGRIAKRHGGTSLPTGLALGMRHQPFNPITPLMFGPKGESTIPSNAMVPLSQAERVARVVDDVVASRRRELDRFGVSVGNNYLVTRHVFGVEPLISYPDSPSEYRLRWVPDEMAAALRQAPHQPEALEAALALRAAFIEAFRELGAVHIQIGRTYPLREAMAGRTWDFIEQLKAVVDPDGIINPGVLGLDSGDRPRGNGEGPAGAGPR